MKKVLHRSFKPAKCKTALQMASSRLKILKNKKDIQIKQLRRELAQLLESGQTQTARIRVEHVVREEKTVAAYELVGIFCELLVARLAVIESQKNCPTDLKEAVASVLYASQRIADVPELSDVVKHFSAKYGKDFASAAVQLRPDSGVSRLLVEKLSVKAPDGPTKVKILTGIAEEHNVKWEAKSLMEPDPKYADVLSGPSSFESAGRTHADSPTVPDKDPPNAHYGSSERTRVPVNSYPHYGISSSRAQSVTPPDVSHGNSSDYYHPNARPSGDRTHGVEHRHQNPGDGNTSPREWETEFSDSTAAARAAAESAERASIAARAAAELSSKERMMRQNSTDSQNSYSSYSNRNEHPHRRSSSNVKGEDRSSSPRRMHYEEMGSTKHVDSSWAKASEFPNDELSETTRGRRGSHSRENLETRQTDSFDESGREKQLGESDLNVGFSDEVQLRKQSSRASSRSHSRTVSDDRVVGSDYIESPSLEGNIFATDDKNQPRSSPEESYHHDSDRDDDDAFDDYGSFFDKPQFDKEGTHDDELQYGSVPSLLDGKTLAREDIDGWSLTGDRVESLGNYSSSSQVFQENSTSPVFDSVSTSPVAPLHEPEQSVKFDDYGHDSETEEDEPTDEAEISGVKPVGERLNSTSRSSPRFQELDEAGHEFFPSDTDEPKYDSGTREESDSETQMGLSFGALTGGLRNKKTLPPCRINPARDATSSKPEKEYTQTNVDMSMASSPSVSSRRDRKELGTEKARDREKKPISTPSDPSSSDDSSDTELPVRTETETRASYLHLRIGDGDSEKDEFPRRASIRNQERSNKQMAGGRDYKRPDVKTQATTLKLSSPFSDDDGENEIREEATPHSNVKPRIGFSRRTQGEGKATEKGSSSGTTSVAKTDKGERVQRSPTKSPAKQQPPSSTSSSFPKVVTSSAKAKGGDASASASAGEAPSKERGSHVHPKLPDYDDLFATFGSLRPNRR